MVELAILTQIPEFDPSADPFDSLWQSGPRSRGWETALLVMLVLLAMLRDIVRSAFTIRHKPAARDGAAILVRSAR